MTALSRDLGLLRGSPCGATIITSEQYTSASLRRRLGSGTVMVRVHLQTDAKILSLSPGPGGRWGRGEALGNDTLGMGLLRKHRCHHHRPTQVTRTLKHIGCRALSHTTEHRGNSGRKQDAQINRAGKAFGSTRTEVVIEALGLFD